MCTSCTSAKQPCNRVYEKPQIAKSEVCNQAQDCPPRNHVGLANWPAVPSPMDFGSFRHRNCEHCRSGLGGGVVKDEIELAWWKLLSVINIEQIEVDHHHLDIYDAQQFQIGRAHV